MIEEIDIEIPDPNDECCFDSLSDPAHPTILDFKLVLEAKDRIKSGVPVTRCDRSRLSSEYGMEIYFKKEFELPTGSYKERGAYNNLKSFTQVQRIKGAIAASTGNHASAMAYHGKKLGIPVTVVMPTCAPLLKIKNCLSYGANIVLKGPSITEARRVALRLARDRGLTFVNGYDHPLTMAGQGTIGLEILEQVPDVDAVIVPIGGAGSLAGIAKAIKEVKSSVKVYGVESVMCPAYTNALAAGKPFYTSCDSTLADGLFVPLVGVNALETSKNLIEKVAAIDESHDCRAILKLLEFEKAVVEGAGAMSFAAIIGNYFPELKGKTVVCVLSGGNIDSLLLGRVIDRALAIENRIIQFTVPIDDRVGGLATLTKNISDNGACIRDIFTERCWLKSDVFKVVVKCRAETKDEKHAQEFIKKLSNIYPALTWEHHE